MTDFKKPIEDVAEDVKDFVELKIDDVKIKTTKGLSVSLARVIAYLVILFTGMLAVIALTVALVLLVGEMTGNYSIGAFIAFGVFAIALLVLFLLRKKMFTGSFVKMFVKIFFPEDEE